MKCPKCNHSESKVIDTREKYAEQQTYRRRQCAECKHRWSTVEVNTEDYKTQHVVETETIKKLKDILGQTRKDLYLLEGELGIYRPFNQKVNRHEKPLL